MKKMQL